MNKFWEAPE